MKLRRLILIALMACLTVAAVFLLAANTTRSALDQRRTAEYFSQNSIRRLQVGAGPNNLPGWLNSDIDPIEGQIYLDATARFPFPDNTFRYVYAEQLIEHLAYPEASDFLKESWRVLEPGGKIRLATPNLLQLIALFNKAKTPIQQRFMEYQLRENRLADMPVPETALLNRFVRAWGHRFLYDPESLSATLQRAGFINISQQMLGASGDPDLAGIEMHWKMGGKEIDEYISMYVEATKPAVITSIPTP